MEILLSNFVSLKDKMSEKRNKAWSPVMGMSLFFFLPTTCLTFSKSPNVPGRFHPDHEVIEHVDRLCWSIWLRRSQRVSALTLLDFNLGQVQFPPLWKERIVVLWEAVVNFMNLSVSLTSLVKTYTVFPRPLHLDSAEELMRMFLQHV